MPKSIPKGLSASHVRKAIKDINDGIKHSFGKQKRYSVIYNGNRYAPKAVIGVAFRYLTGKILPPRAFSGGVRQGQANYVLQGQANYVLQELGFQVVDMYDGGTELSSQLAELSKKVSSEGYFKPATLEDERQRKLREVVQRYVSSEALLAAKTTTDLD